MQINCFAIVELPVAISLENSALGIEVPATIRGHEFRLQTPALVKANSDTQNCDIFGDFEGNLGPPNAASLLLKTPSKIDWGELTSTTRSGQVSAQVKHLLAVFTATGLSADALSSEIHLSNGEWLRRLDSFIRLISGQRTLSVIRVSGANNSRFQLYQSNPTKHLTHPGPSIRISINRHASCTSATGEQFADAVRICSEGKIAPLHYELLLRAHNAHQENDPRNTVIEASTALEVTATRRIRSKLSDDRVPEKHVELMLKGHQTLRNRMALLKSVGVTYSCSKKAFDDEILKIRNKVVHGGHRVTDSEASKLLVLVDRLIREITPEFAVDPEP